MAQQDLVQTSLAQSTDSQLTIAPMSGTIGAEVSGIDLAQPLDPAVMTQVKQAFLDHHVLVFRNQQITPEQQITFGKHFGPLDTHPFVHPNANHPEIIDVITEADDTSNFGGGWHSDLTFLEEPDLGSILYALDVPAQGGDTLFANQHAAYEMLSDTMKDMLQGLRAVHSAGPQYAEGGLSTKSKSMATRESAEAQNRSTEHPVIRTHPETGKKALYVNQAFTTHIRTLKARESRALLAMLYEVARHEAITCRVRWEPGTLTMWDNRSVKHFALWDYKGTRRHLQRVTVKGDRPV